MWRIHPETGKRGFYPYAASQLDRKWTIKQVGTIKGAKSNDKYGGIRAIAGIANLTMYSRSSEKA